MGATLQYRYATADLASTSPPCFAPTSIDVLANCSNPFPPIAVNGLMSVEQNATAAFNTLSLALCGTDPLFSETL